MSQAGSQSRSRSRSSIRQQQDDSQPEPHPAAQRSRTRSRSPSSRSEAITLSIEGNNNEDVANQTGSQFEQFAALLAENERMEKELATLAGGEAALVLPGVGGKSGGSWLLAGACQAGRCLCIACCRGLFCARQIYQVRKLYRGATKVQDAQQAAPVESAFYVWRRSVHRRHSQCSRWTMQATGIESRQGVCLMTCLQRSGPYRVTGRCAMMDKGEIQLELVSTKKMGYDFMPAQESIVDHLPHCLQSV